jgi:hypothetical protein
MASLDTSMALLYVDMFQIAVKFRPASLPCLLESPSGVSYSTNRTVGMSEKLISSLSDNGLGPTLVPGHTSIVLSIIV